MMSFSTLQARIRFVTLWQRDNVLLLFSGTTELSILTLHLVIVTPMHNTTLNSVHVQL